MGRAVEGAIRADVVHGKLVKMGYRGSERSTRRAVNAAKERVEGGQALDVPAVDSRVGRWLQFDWGEGPRIGGRRTWPLRVAVLVAVPGGDPGLDGTLGTLVACLDN